MTQSAPGERLMRQARGQVVSSEAAGSGYRRLVIEQPGIAADCRPGQLVYVACQSEGEERAFSARRCAPVRRERRFSDIRILRRPFAVAGRRDGRFDLLLKVVGPGSEWLARRRPGQAVDIIGPLGNGFDLAGVRSALLVGGGTGVASMLALAQECAGAGLKAAAVVGARSLALAPLPWRPGAQGRVVEALEALGVESTLVTEQEDGLLATQALEEMLARVQADEVDVFACGPWAMMAAVSRLTQGRFRCQVSLEARMGCGVGACKTCAVPVRVGGDWTYKTVCRDGPVFKAEEVIWEKPPI